MMPWAHALLLVVSVFWTLFGIDLSEGTWENQSFVALCVILPTYFFFSIELLLVGMDLHIMHAKFVLKSFFRYITLRSTIYIGFALLCGCLFVQTENIIFLIIAVVASSGLKFEEVWAQNNVDRYISQHKKGIYERTHRPKKIR